MTPTYLITVINCMWVCEVNSEIVEKYHIYTSENNWLPPIRVGAPGCLHEVAASPEGTRLVN